MNISILLFASAKGGLAVALAVTLYPFKALVTIVTSWAPMTGVPATIVPNGMVVAVVSMVVDAPLTDEDEVTPSTVKVNVGSTDAVTATEVVVNVANAVVPVSRVEGPEICVVILMKNVVSVVVGLVMPVYGTVMTVPLLIEAGEVTVRVMVPLVVKFEVLALSPVTDP